MVSRDWTESAAEGTDWLPSLTASQCQYCVSVLSVVVIIVLVIHAEVIVLNHNNNNIITTSAGPTRLIHTVVLGNAVNRVFR